ncbi:alpha/beta fold hydrolase [Flavobacterium caeni]|uniref:Pimeloyl-ACP methyl ester carboxylesterase n=1 Tax=Flavobacterium caeni TaxID=490189 RepID=A0A1G5FUI5_9FLAO|nr:alpha/beta hydrolase [Flavobacterium caeni]SCY42450.1 Pimeloyl-ACP methyl ester carboxylesterase [Flavobacterium caeni]
MRKIKIFLLTKSIGLYLNILSYARPQKAKRLAYQFFSQPREGRLHKEKLPEVLRETQAETFAYDGHQVQFYTWKGNTHVVLLVHGWESNAARWEQLLPYLRQSGSTVVAVDAPAHGLSSGVEFTVPRYAEFIDVAVQKFKPDALVGHSIGGAACVYHQYRYPDTGVSKMVLLGTPSDFQILVDNFGKMLGLNNRMILMLEQYFTDNFQIRTRDFTASIFGEKLLLDGIIAHDVNDEVVAFAEAKKIAQSWKQATFIETKGLGHSMHDDVLYGKVRDFLAKD